MTAGRHLADNPAVFGIYESSGLWDAPVSAWKQAADHLQKAKIHGIPVRAGIHTEATRDQVIAAFKNQPGHWAFVRMDKGSDEIVATYDRDFLHIERAHAILMSTTQIRTKTGHLQPQTHMLEAVATYLPTGRRVYLEGLHWPLRNTPARAKSWRECEEKATHHWSRILDNDPDALIVHLGDLNESMRKMVERRRVLDLAAGVPGMHQVWNLRDLPAQGTHGPKDIIDNCVTNARVLSGGAVLLPRVPKFDHRPLGVLLGAPELADTLPHDAMPTRGLKVAPIIEPDLEHEPLPFAA